MSHLASSFARTSLFCAFAGFAVYSGYQFFRVSAALVSDVFESCPLNDVELFNVAWLDPPIPLYLLSKNIPLSPCSLLL